MGACGGVGEGGVAELTFADNPVGGHGSWCRRCVRRGGRIPLCGIPGSDERMYLSEKGRQGCGQKISMGCASCGCGVACTQMQWLALRRALGCHVIR